jgi:hypothetical protein
MDRDRAVDVFFGVAMVALGLAALGAAAAGTSALFAFAPSGAVGLATRAGVAVGGVVLSVMGWYTARYGRSKTESTSLY